MTEHSTPVVGLLYQPSFEDFLVQPDCPADYVEIIPDTIWHDRGADVTPRFVVDHDQRASLDRLRSRIPVMLHGIGLSIGSAARLDEQYVAQLLEWVDWLDSPWLSEHLAFSVVELDEGAVNAGLTLPVPLDDESLTMIGARVEQVLGGLGRPFLLENNVYYFGTPHDSYGEAAFLNRLCHDHGADLLLDLHNLHCNAVNGVMSPESYLAELDLGRVREIHIAGGMEVDGFYVDGHCAAPPEPVWALLEQVVPLCPNLAAVTFEMLGSWAGSLPPGGLTEVLERMRAVTSGPRCSAVASP